MREEGSSKFKIQNGKLKYSMQVEIQNANFKMKN